MAFHVHPDGQMALCIEDVPLFDLTTGSVLEGWNGPIRERRNTPLPSTHELLNHWGAWKLVGSSTSSHHKSYLFPPLP